MADLDSPINNDSTEPSGGSPDGDSDDGAGLPPPAADEPQLVPIEKFRKKMSENKSLRTRLREAEAQLAEQTGEADEASLSALHQFVEAEVAQRTHEARVEAVAAKVVAAAVKQGWATPEDATLFLDVSDLVGESSEQIADRLVEVTTDRPHLLAARTRGGSFDQGPRGAVRMTRPQSVNDMLLEAIGVSDNGLGL